MAKKTKVWLMTGAILAVVGCLLFGGVMMALKWDFSKLSTVKYETNRYELNSNFLDLSVITDTTDLVLVPSQSGKTEVVCYEQENAKHSVSVKDGKLVIELVNTKKWYQYIGISVGKPKITIAIPQREYGDLTIKASTGSITLERLSVGGLDLTVSTGKVTVKDVICAGNVTIAVSTGKTELANLTCKNLTTRGSTGKINLQDVIAEGKLWIERSTGHVDFARCDAGEIQIETDTGHVIGTFLTEKIVFAKTDTGRVEVPRSTTGGRCEISTDTGNIKVQIAP